MKHIGFGKLSGFLTFATDSIYILGDPFEGEVCLCWEIPWEVAMSVQTLQQDGAEKGPKIGDSPQWKINPIVFVKQIKVYLKKIQNKTYFTF